MWHPQQTKAKNSFFHRPCSGTLVLVLVLFLCMSCSLPPQSSTPTSWKTQLSIAQAEVHKIDPDAVLFRAVAHLDDIGGKRPDNTLLVQLQFIRPAGTFIKVQYEDTRITDTLKVQPTTGGFTPALTADERKQYQRDVEFIQIGPAEIIQHTLAEGQAFLEQHNADMHLAVGIHLGMQEIFGIPAAWSIIYFAPPYEHRIWLNAQTGAIVGHNSDGFYPPSQRTPTNPLPSPVPR